MDMIRHDDKRPQVVVEESHPALELPHDDGCYLGASQKHRSDIQTKAFPADGLPGGG